MAEVGGYVSRILLHNHKLSSLRPRAHPHYLQIRDLLQCICNLRKIGAHGSFLAIRRYDLQKF